MRTVLACILALCCAAAGQTRAAESRLDLPLEQRLEVPLSVAGTSVTLVDFVGFVATSYKVPLLVETTSPLPDLEIGSGSYTARELLNIAVRRLPGYEWRDEGGVAHLYQPALERTPGNLLNVSIPQFESPKTVGEFMYLFRPCISSVIKGYSCEFGVYSGFMLPELKQPGLPQLEFKDASARDILLRTLQANGHFYVLVAFESEHPRLKSEFPFRNWFAESLEEERPGPMWVQRPKR